MEEKIKLMTIREIAKTKIISEYTLRNMVKQGDIPHVKSGNRTLINYYVLEKLLLSRTAT